MKKHSGGCDSAVSRGRTRRACLAAAAAAAVCVTAPAAFAQQAGGFAGSGAALCIAAGELLAAQPGADPAVAEGVLAWRQILHAIEGTASEREAAVQSSRAALGDVRLPPERAAIVVRSLWSAGCAERDDQVQHLAVHGSADRIRTHLADLPGAALGDEAAERMNDSALCLAAAELASRPRPSAALRNALRQAAPAVPEAGVLQAIRERARRELDAVPGSAAGRELLVDYLRYLFDGGTRGANSQAIVNRVTETLNGSCREGIS